jgi:hypothetical protein
MFVCMSRRICVDLYNTIAQLRPDWIDPDDAAGALKVVMTGSAADPIEWQPHIGNKARREALAKRFKNPNDSFKFAIVRDMWLTGFDVPSLHTLYLDKPMRGHGLMQAIARQSFKDKLAFNGDYLGLADELRKALAAYAEDDQRRTSIAEEAVACCWSVVVLPCFVNSTSVFPHGHTAQRRASCLPRWISCGSRSGQESLFAGGGRTLASLCLGGAASSRVGFAGRSGVLSSGASGLHQGHAR